MVVLSTIDNNKLIEYLYVCIVINVALSRGQCSINQLIAQAYSCESIDCELLKTSQIAFNRYSQLKPDLWYMVSHFSSLNLERLICR